MGGGEIVSALDKIKTNYPNAKPSDINWCSFCKSVQSYGLTPRDVRVIKTTIALAAILLERIKLSTKMVKVRRQ